jgi:hypothetical protein
LGFRGCDFRSSRTLFSSALAMVFFPQITSYRDAVD